MDLNWLWVVPVLGILIVVHEAGHFFAARWLGIKVEEFGIGFPPRVFAIRRNGIDYSLNLLPIGGFVKIVGENGESDDPESFGRAPAWKRIVVLAAGSMMNLLLALLIFMGMSIAGTREIDAPDTGVAGLVKDQPAISAGMQPGDKIVSVAGQPVTTSGEIRSLSKANAGKEIVFEVERNGNRLPLRVKPNLQPPVEGQYLGVNLGPWISPAKVDQVRSGGLAEKAGLKSGDVIVEVNDTPVNNTAAVRGLIGQAEGPVTLVAERSGQRVPVTLDPGAGQRSFDFGLLYPYRTAYYDPLDALGRALGSTWEVVASVPKGIAQAFEGRSQGPGVTGPVGIGQLTGEVAQQGGFSGLLSLTALLGISLFMINLMPLPALDGGRLLFIFVELLRGGRRIAPEKEGMVHFAGMMVLLMLLAVITIFDVGRLFEGTPLLP